ncbi:hypothetical protein COL940_007645 [Colletotrichum noveboracense]|nr:hypothetical protein COL940_007645 [Colletotrichum noveboracense]
MSFPRIFTLNNGRKVPAVGFGTFQGTEGNSKVKDAVKLALSLGYRHIDGANVYGNEKDIGEAIKESGIPREEIFVTSKLSLAPKPGMSLPTLRELLKPLYVTFN